MKRLVWALGLLLCVGTVSAQDEYYYRKRSLYERLPVERRDIVFVGDGLTEEGAWSELTGDAHVLNRGIARERAEWLPDRLEPLVSGQPRKLFLLVGINDLAAGAAPEEVVTRIGRIVDRVLDVSPRTQIYVQSLLPVNDRFVGLPDGMELDSEIEAVNDALRRLCAERGVGYIDLHSVMADESGRLDARYTNDGLHLMGEGYARWKDAVAKYLD